MNWSRIVDQFDCFKRSEIMSKVRSFNTTPELAIRKLLHGMGYRFRLHRKDLPGKPDIVLPKYNVVIFVNGCFWHGCPLCNHALIRPKTNNDYWNNKLDRTLERDKKNIVALKKLGWRVLTVWECQTKKKVIDRLENKLTIYFQKIRKD